MSYFTNGPVSSVRAGLAFGYTRLTILRRFGAGRFEDGESFAPFAVEIKKYAPFRVGFLQRVPK